MKKLDLERGHLAGRGGHSSELMVHPVFDLRRQTVDLSVLIPEEWHASLGRGFECYFHLYTADLGAPTQAWVPHRPITYPQVSSRSTPFGKRLHRLRFEGRYLGVLVSVCSAFHEEVDRVSLVFRTSDGALISHNGRLTRRRTGS